MSDTIPPDLDEKIARYRLWRIAFWFGFLCGFLIGIAITLLLVILV